MSNDRIDLDRIESVLRDVDNVIDVCSTWQNNAGEREAEYLCTASEMLALVRAVRAALADFDARHEDCYGVEPRRAARQGASVSQRVERLPRPVPQGDAMTEKIDLDAIEKNAQSDIAGGDEWYGDPWVVLALVRAVRAAMAMEPWRVVDVFKVGMLHADAIKPTLDLADALEPFRKAGE